MGHIQNLEHELRNRLAEACEEAGIEAMPSFEAVIKWVKGEVLTSYRNGVEVGAKDGSAARPQTKRTARSRA